MRDKKTRIILKCFCVALTIFMVFSQIAFAWEPNYNALEGHHAANAETKVYSVMGAVINIISITGAGIAIIMLIWLGIRYVNMYTPEQKAEIKKQIPTYVLGAVLIFSASALLKIIQEFVEANINN